MLRDVVAVVAREGHRLEITFDDGVEGTIDVERVIDFVGVFAPLRDLEYFRQVRVNAELGIVCWPNDADLDTDVLYSEITQTPLPVAA